jgi:hypothetical protein
MIDVHYKIKTITLKKKLMSINNLRFSKIHQKYLALIYKIHLKVNNL